MIRYPRALEGIEAEIGRQWLDKARARTDLLRAEGRYVELGAFWGEVKEIYVKRQHGKCVYCESMLEWGKNTGIQWDLEHFRPKSNVRKWPPAKSPLNAKYSHSFLGDEHVGYHLLAYSHRNYAAACKICNSPYKSDYFPVGGSRILADSDPAAYAGEDAFLVYPLDVFDADPIDLIGFDGVVAVPKPDRETDYVRWLRASVIIDFFDLNRDGLQRMRASWLYYSIWSLVKLADAGDAEAVRNLQLARTARLQHANCAACFIDLCESDRAAATVHVEVFKRILELTSGP